MVYVLNLLPSHLLDKCIRLAENDPQAVGKFLAEFALAIEGMAHATVDKDYNLFQGYINTLIDMTNTLGARVG